MIHTLAKEKSTTSVTSGKSAPTPDLRLPLPSRVGSANPIKEIRPRQYEIGATRRRPSILSVGRKEAIILAYHAGQ